MKLINTETNSFRIPSDGTIKTMDEVLFNIDSYIPSIKTCTEINNHTLARIFICDLFGFTKTKRKFQYVKAIQDDEGSFNRHLREYSNLLTDLTLSHIEYFYGKEIRDKINGCI